MQTDSFTILVGPDQCAYKVPEGRLTMHSAVFSSMCSAPFLESAQRIIKLPEEDPSVFEDFYDWMYSSKPHVDLKMGARAVFDLAIFAEKYQICHLKNQISDLLQNDWSHDILDAEILDHVYSSVPEGAVLRQLCVSILKRLLDQGVYVDHCGTWMAKDLFKEYDPVFALHTDLGRDFFRVAAIDRIHPCTFHDHSNIDRPLEVDAGFCPHSYADLILDEAVFEQQFGLSKK